MDYSKYLNKAFRQVVRDILADVAKNGLSDGCAYYLTFETNREDVVLPDFVRAKYPQEITVVLENQFENLQISDQKITVDIAFGGVLSSVEIPYTALKQFADPHHQFGFQLTPERKAPAKIVSIDDLRNGLIE